MTRPLASVLVLLAFSPFLAAQNCELSVKVVTVDERSIEAQVHVDLLSPQGVVATVHVAGGEPARFRVAAGKSYQVTVSGPGLQTTTSSFFQINSLELEHLETVHVKPEAQQAEDASPVSISEINIPKKASNEMKKGLEAYSRNNWDKAAAHFEKALVEYPRYARAYDMLGAIAIKKSDRAKAKELFSKSIQADAAFSPAYVDLARMGLQDQDYAATESLLAKAIALNPSSPDAMALLASAEFANKEYDKALADVQRTHALRNHEQFAEVHIMAGKVLRMQNRPEEAIAQFQLFLKEKPDSPDAENVRREIASTSGQQR